MEILIGAADSTQLKKAKETLRKGWSRFLDDLATWAEDQESRWGECKLFLEISIPAPRWIIHNQLDVVIAFSDRVLILELKDRPFDKLGARHLVKQLSDQLEAMRLLVKQRSLDSMGVSIALYDPQLEVGRTRELREVLKSNHSSQHIPIWDSGLTQQALVQRIAECLKSIHPIPVGHGPGIQARIHEALGPTITFPSFQLAREYLRRVYPDRLPDFSPDPWHVPRLREREQREARAAIEREGVVELVGPPGIGRSTLAKTIANDLRFHGYEYCHNLHLRKVRLVEDAAALVHAQGFEDTDTSGFPKLLTDLAENHVVYWISSYDPASALVLRELVEALQKWRASSESGLSSAWIVQSRAPALEGIAPQVVLAPLTPDELAEILHQHPAPPDVRHSIHDIVLEAQGNPQLAIWLWSTQRDVGEAPIGAERRHGLSWVFSALSQAERECLVLLGWAIGQVPLGLTLHAYLDWVDHVLSRLGPGTARLAAVDLVSKLRTWNLIQVDELEASAADGFLPADLPGTVRLTVLRGVNQDLIDDARGYALVSQPHETLAALCEIWEKQATHESHLAFVTALLNSGDLGTFFWSSFRHTHLASCLEWWDAQGPDWSSLTARDEAYLGCLRVQQQVIRGASANPAWEGALPDLVRSDVSLGRAVALTRWLAEIQTTRGDLRGLQDALARAEAIHDPDIRAEVVVRASQGVAACEEIGEALRLCEGLLALPLPVPVRMLALTQSLALLNRTKLIREAGFSDDARQGKMETYARALLALSTQEENILATCNAWYYHVRTKELLASKTPTRSVLVYIHPLEVIERISPARRLQALITQSSVYRHFCRCSDLSWSEYQEAMERSRVLLRRVMDSAIARDVVYQQLNAASYLNELPLLALRHAEDAKAPQVIAEAAREADAVITTTRARLTGHPLDAFNREILRTIRLYHGVAAYLGSCRAEGLTEQNLDHARGLLRDTEAACSEIAKELPRRDQVKTFLRLLIVLTRTLKMAPRWQPHQARHAAILRPTIARILRIVDAGGFRDGKLLKSRYRLERDLDEYCSSSTI